MNIDWSKYGVADVREPTPEEIEQAIRRSARMRAEAFREAPGVFVGWLRRAAAWIDDRQPVIGSQPFVSAGNAGRTIA